MIKGINHITLAVRDLEVSFRFYAEILGMTPRARWYKGAYLEAGGNWICLSLDETTRNSALPEYTHLAFTVEVAEFSAMVEQLQAAGVQRWQENRSPGESFYFLDPNGHKLEIHISNLQDRLKVLVDRPPKDLILFPAT
ncbi:fosfomycin resistance glutathione transferase [Edaphobacter albus]|uniref:fosfomycin resistance glutathione transferase n=1 Tax=Edaphobacter sp. 4G125 TaxID=2763071 RepID=UPI00164745F6|nr:fosfomycin resistance glutathione transferase [Edaphobacter sp. 4G125]QNI36405.1 fosfomycin resistance glutathione transferase [Edaphobacter sp. 4G125]